MVKPLIKIGLKKKVKKKKKINVLSPSGAVRTKVLKKVLR